MQCEICSLTWAVKKVVSNSKSCYCKNFAVCALLHRFYFCLLSITEKPNYCIITWNENKSIPINNLPFSQNSFFFPTFFSYENQCLSFGADQWSNHKINLQFPLKIGNSLVLYHHSHSMVNYLFWFNAYYFPISFLGPLKKVPEKFSTLISKKRVNLTLATPFG